MNNRSTKGTGGCKSMYDQFPDLYLNAVGIPEKVRKNISEVLVNALSEAFPDEKEFRILEPGIGLGQITKELWRPLETQRLRAQVYGIDISKEMLQELYLRLQKNGFSRITDTVWQKETLTIRGFKDDFLKWKNSPTSNFHAIFPIFFLHHLYDKWQEGLLKCFSALAPSGIIAVAEDAGDTVVWDGWFQNLDIEPLISNIEKFERRRKFIRLGRIFTEELTKGGHREFLPLRAGYMQPVLHVLDSPLFKKIDKKEFEWESTIKLVDKTEGWLNALEEKALSPLRCVAEKHRKKIMQNIKEEARALFGNLDVEIPIKRKLRLYLYEKLPFSDFESVAKHFVMHVNEAEFVRLGNLPRPSSPDSQESCIDQTGTLLSIANYGIVDKGVEMFHAIRWRDQIESWERNIPVYVYGKKKAAIKTFGKLIAYHFLTKHFIEEREFKGADLIFKDFPEKFVLDTVYVSGSDGFSWRVHYHPTGNLYKLKLKIPKTINLPNKLEEIIRKEIERIKKEDPSCIVAHRQMGYIFSYEKLAQRISPSISKHLKDLNNDEVLIESIKNGLLSWIDFQEFLTGNQLWKKCRDKLENFARILVCVQVLGDRISYYPIATFLNGNDQQHSSGGYIFVGSKDMSVKGNAILNYGGLTFRSRSVGDWAEKERLNEWKILTYRWSHNIRNVLETMYSYIYGDSKQELKRKYKELCEINEAILQISRNPEKYRKLCKILENQEFVELNKLIIGQMSDHVRTFCLNENNRETFESYVDRLGLDGKQVSKEIEERLNGSMYPIEFQLDNTSWVSVNIEIKKNLRVNKYCGRILTIVFAEVFRNAFKNIEEFMKYAREKTVRVPFYLYVKAEECQDAKYRITIETSMLPGTPHDKINVIKYARGLGGEAQNIWLLNLMGVSYDDIKLEKGCDWRNGCKKYLFKFNLLPELFTVGEKYDQKI
jgi:hypothetical protein